MANCTNTLDALEDLAAYLQASEIIDWRNPAIIELAGTIRAVAQSNATAGTQPTPEAMRANAQAIATAQACFEWVRDEICHSVDYQMNPVTCQASEVLQYKTGYCYAKSHLLAALLRANDIPAGFCYQRLSIYDNGAPYCLHGLNAVYLPTTGWYRMDARGNRAGVNAQFTPPTEQLAFKLQFPEEVDCQTIFPEPLPVVIEALQAHKTWDELLLHLPDSSLEAPLLGNAHADSGGAVSAA